MLEQMEEETLEAKVALVVDVAERFMADPRDVTPAEVAEAKALLASMRHYDAVLAPIRGINFDWRGKRGYDSDVPPPPRESAGA